MIQVSQKCLWMTICKQRESIRELKFGMKLRTFKHSELMDRRLESAQGLVVGRSFQVGYDIVKTMKYKKPSELDITHDVGMLEHFEVMVESLYDWEVYFGVPGGWKMRMVWGQGKDEKGSFPDGRQFNGQWIVIWIMRKDEFREDPF